MKKVTYNTVKIDGQNIFYREAGDNSKPTILLLHGFPSSSFMFRNLIPLLADKFHLVAPDYPGFGQSSMPKVNEFEYTFENLTNIVDKFTQQLKLDKYSIYVQDYGSPIGFRLAVKHPERIQAVIVQNGNAYEIGLGEPAAPLKSYGETGDEKFGEKLKDLLTLEATKEQYIGGARIRSASRRTPGRSTNLCSTAKAIRQFSSSSSKITTRTFSSMTSGTNTSVNTSRRRSSSGERTIRFLRLTAWKMVTKKI